MWQEVCGKRRRLARVEGCGKRGVQAGKQRGDALSLNLVCGEPGVANNVWKVWSLGLLWEFGWSGGEAASLPAGTARCQHVRVAVAVHLQSPIAPLLRPDPATPLCD